MVKRQKTFYFQVFLEGSAQPMGGSGGRLGARQVARNQLETRWKKEFKARQKLFNALQKLRGNILVFCHVHPLNKA